MRHTNDIFYFFHIILHARGLFTATICVHFTRKKVRMQSYNLKVLIHYLSDEFQVVSGHCLQPASCGQGQVRWPAHRKSVQTVYRSTFSYTGYFPSKQAVQSGNFPTMVLKSSIRRYARESAPIHLQTSSVECSAAMSCLAEATSVP